MNFCYWLDADIADGENAEATIPLKSGRNIWLCQSNNLSEMALCGLKQRGGILSDSTPKRTTNYASFGLVEGFEAITVTVPHNLNSSPIPCRVSPGRSLPP